MLSPQIITQVYEETLLSDYQNSERSKNRKLKDYIKEENFHPTQGVEHTDFQCRVCFELRDQLKKCAECQTFICTPCLNKVSGPGCPHCRNEPLDCVKLNRFE